MQTFCQLDLKVGSQRHQTALTVEIDQILIYLCTEVAGVKSALTKQVAARLGFTYQYNQ